MSVPVKVADFCQLQKIISFVLFFLLTEPQIGAMVSLSTAIRPETFRAKENKMIYTIYPIERTPAKLIAIETRTSSKQIADLVAAAYSAQGYDVKTVKED